MSLLLALPALSGATVLTAQVEGDVFLKLKQHLGDVPVHSGSLLPEDAIIKFGDGAKLSLLCLETSELRVVQSKESMTDFCNASSRVIMRSSKEDKIPFIVIPNQRSLSSLDRVIWTGSQGNSFTIKVYHSDASGRKKVVREWSGVIGRYRESGYYEFRLEEPMDLPINEPGEKYRIQVDDEDNSHSSRELRRLCKSITAQAPADALSKANEVVKTLNIQDHPDFAKLIVAAQLSAQGHRAEAYSLLDSVLDNDYEVEKRIIKARLLHIPGIPLDVIVAEYAAALQEAVKRSDRINAIVACHGVAVDSSLLSERGRSAQSGILGNPEYAPYCP